MTAYTSLDRNSSAYRQHNLRCSALSDATGTWSIADNAIRNLMERKPAFWAKCGNSNAPAGTFFETCNRLASIQDAQEDLRSFFARHNRDVTDEKWLDTLLPLNHAAVMDLMRAYHRVGTFRTPDELLLRTEKYERPASLDHLLMAAVAKSLTPPADEPAMAAE